MPPKGFVLWFTGLPSATRTAIANRTAHELKRCGCKIETLDSKTAAVWISVLGDSKSDEDAYIRHLRRVCESGIRDEAIVLAAIQSKTPETPEDLRSSLQASIEVQIGIQKDDESCNAVEGEYQHLTSTKIVVQPDAAPGQCTADILSKLAGLELIPRLTAKDSSYDEDDEAEIRRRLEGLGYL